MLRRKRSFFSRMEASLLTQHFRLDLLIGIIVTCTYEGNKQNNSRKTNVPKKKKLFFRWKFIEMEIRNTKKMKKKKKVFPIFPYDR